MTGKEALNNLKEIKESRAWSARVDNTFDIAIEALEQQDRIIQILDDYDLEAWEILEKIKEVVRE